MPRKETIKKIIAEFASKIKTSVPELKDLDIVPEIKDKKFTFSYIVENVECEGVEKVYIKIISGSKSFLDYLIFFQEEEPNTTDKPMFAIEETKVDIGESRNVTAYQRNTKFVYLSYFFQDIESLVIYFRDFPSDELDNTYSLRFGIRLLLTMGVNIWGIRNLAEYKLEPFKSVDELIEYKNKMPPPASGQRVMLTKKEDIIELSIKLDKGSGVAENRISHDPNVGQAASIIYCLRKLGWEGKIILTNHHVTQENFSRARSKLVSILFKEDATLFGLTMPSRFDLPSEYWTKEVRSEKMATIFLHVILSRLDNVEAIFDNHAGCERGYLKLNDGTFQTLPKTIFVPDLVICDHNNHKILDIEGKKDTNVELGISEIENYDEVENDYIKVSYPLPYTLERWVVLYGGTGTNISHEKVAFLLNENGQVIVSENAPEMIKESTKEYHILSK